MMSTANHEHWLLPDEAVEHYHSAGYVFPIDAIPLSTARDAAGASRP